MSSRGRRYSGESKLNIKKVIAVIVAIAVVIMFVMAIKTLLTTNTNEKDTTVVSYFALYTNGKWGVIDSLGNIVIEPTMQEMITVLDNKTALFILVYDVDYTTGTYKTKVIDAKNKEKFANYQLVEAIENKDENNIMWYEEAVLRVKKDDKFGLIDYSGKEILAPEYESIQALQGVTNSLIIKKGEHVGLCDNKGNIIIPAEYKEIQKIEDNYKNGYIVINNENQYGLIDFAGTQILETKYEEIKQVASTSMYVVKENGTLKLINKDGEALVEGKFDDVKQINNDEIVFIKNKKYGVMTRDGQTKIPSEYDDITYAFNDKYIAKKSGKYGIITNTNEQALPFEYTKISYRKEASFLEAETDSTNTQILDTNLETKLEGIISEVNTLKGYIRIREGEDYKYYNLKFEEKPSTELLSNTLFLTKKDGKYGYKDKDGNLVIDYIYEDATEQNQYGYAAVKKDGKWGAIDKTGKTVCEPQYELTDNLTIDFISKWHISKDPNTVYYTDEI